MIKGILFDKDGTLIEFKTMWHKVTTLFLEKISNEYSLNALECAGVCEILGYREEGFTQDSLMQYLETSRIMEILADYIVLNKCESCNALELTQWFNCCATSDEVTIVAMSGAVQTLKWLKEKGCILGIVTADTYDSTLHSLAKVQLLEYFSFLGSDDGTMKAKPEPHMLELFCERHGLFPDEVLVVGDSLGDYEFATNGRARFIGIRTDYSGLNALESQGVDLISELPELIEKIAS